MEAFDYLCAVLGAAHVAKLLDVSTATIRRWDRLRAVPFYKMCLLGFLADGVRTDAVRRKRIACEKQISRRR